jgi:beta-glucosidase
MILSLTLADAVDYVKEDINDAQICAYITELIETSQIYIESCVGVAYQSDEKAEAFANEPFKSKSDMPDEKLIAEAVEVAQKVEFAIIFAGLPENYESEGFDRKHMNLPEGQDKLIEAVCAVQKNVVVVLSNGAPVEMPWIDRVKGVLECYLGGEAFGAAAADMLFGDVNPSGKLAETFPVKLCDNPSYLNFPGDDKNVEYREGLFVGYRYYDKKQVKPLFPFGFGLSYTNFEYTGISIDRSEILDTDRLTVNVSVKNTGKYAGKEVVQLYVSDVETNVVRPVKELKGFAKVALEPGEEKTVSFVLDKRSFAYYNTSLKDWVVESGEFKIMAGKSSAEIVLEKSVFVKSTTIMEEQYDLNTTFEVLKRNPKAGPIVDELLKMLSEGMGIPLSEDNGMFEMFKTSPLRQFVQLSQGKISERRIMEMLNRLG